MLAFAAQEAAGHGFGQRFDLPLPLWLWVVGAGFTIAVSFSIVIDFLPPRLLRPGYPRVVLRARGSGAALTARAAAGAARLLAVGALVVTIAAGLAGSQEPTANLAPTMIWVIWWVGVAFVCALLFDLWAVVNPWRTLFRWAEDAYARATGGRVLARGRALPEGTGVWICVVVMAGFAWCEHVWSSASVPRSLALAAIAYSGFTFTGMFVFGREQWLRQGEGFGCAFSVLARFAPLRAPAPVVEGQRTAAEVSQADAADAGRGAGNWILRLPSTGLLDDRPVHISMVFFVLLLLATVTFDGLIETPLWSAVAASAGDALGFDGTQGGAIVTTLGLLAFPLLFVAVFWTCTLAMHAIARRANPGDAGADVVGPSILAKHFVLTLVPIAVAYHLAHYISFLVVSGQRIVPLVSDPLGRGWDVLGTAGYVLDPGLIGVDVVWYVVVTSIVLGHVLSVYLAHVVALDVFRDKRVAVRAEAPMLVLMVGYTMVSLWILAQPIFE